MFNKEMMLSAKSLNGGYESIEGTLVAGANEYYVGYMSSFGSCTAPEVFVFYDSPTTYYGGVIALSNEILTVPAFYAIRCSIFVNGVERSAYITQSAYMENTNTVSWITVSESAPTYNAYTVVAKDGGDIGSKVVASRSIEWPYLLTSEEVANYRNQQAESVAYGYTFTGREYKVDELIRLTDPKGLDWLDVFGFVNAQAYPFTLKYKIDAIITEDGVQTF